MVRQSSPVQCVVGRSYAAARGATGRRRTCGFWRCGITQPVSSSSFTLVPGGTIAADLIEDRVGELDVNTLQEVLELGDRARSEDCRGDRRVGDREGDRQVGEGDSRLVGDPLQLRRRARTLRHVTGDRRGRVCLTSVSARPGRQVDGLDGSAYLPVQASRPANGGLTIRRPSRTSRSSGAPSARCPG